MASPLPRGLKPLMFRRFYAALKRCSTRKHGLPGMPCGEKQNNGFAEQISSIARNERRLFEQIPFDKLRAGSPVGRNDKGDEIAEGRSDGWLAIGRRCVRWDGGATLAEFAVTLPLLVVILYGVFDFGSALVLKQKLEHAVYEAVRAASSQSTDDLTNTAAGTAGSVADLRDTVARNLQNAGVNDCGLLGASPTAGPQPASTWSYSVSGGGCPAALVLTIRREDVLAVGTPAVNVFVSRVTLQYPFQYFSVKALALVSPGATFAASTNIVADASMKNLL